MESETSFINSDRNEAGSIPDDVSIEVDISRGRPSNKMRTGNTLSRSLRRRRPPVAPLHSNNSELFSNTYGTFEDNGIRMDSRLSSSGEDHVMTIEAHRVHQHRSFGERTKMKWSRWKESVEEKLEFFSVSRAMECYGGGAFSYFKFVVWLGRVNFLTMLLYIGALLLPFFIVNRNETFADTIAGKDGVAYQQVNTCSILYENQIKNYTDKRMKNVLDVALDVLQGTGVMEAAPFLFIGQFFDKILYDRSPLVVQYNTALAFYLCLWATLFAVLLATIISSGKRALKRIQVYTGEATYTFKTLSRWDFMMRDRRRAKVERRSIALQLKKELEEEKRRLDKETMSRSQRFTITCRRIFAWFLYLIMMGGSFVGIYYVIIFSSQETAKESQKNSQNAILLFLLQYFPTIFIFVTNFIIELYCSKIVPYEDYSANRAISITIFRTVSLRFISLGVLIASMFIELNRCHRTANNGDKCVPDKCKTVTCWETYVGQQIFRLVLLDFLAFLAICLVDLIRKFFCGCIKTDVSTVFDIPKNVIDLIYTQTLCWLGMFFCPLLPVAVFVKIIIIYFFKKMCVVFHIYQQDERISNAAQTDSYFLDTLLVALIFVVILPLGIGTSLFHPSRSCSPYRLYSATDTDSLIKGPYIALESAITEAFSRLGTQWLDVYKVINSHVVLIPTWIILILVIYYFLTLSAARKTLNRHLKVQMVREMQDEAFHQKRAMESLKALKIAQRAQNR